MSANAEAIQAEVAELRKAVIRLAAITDHFLLAFNNLPDANTLAANPGRTYPYLVATLLWLRDIPENVTRTHDESLNIMKQREARALP